MTVQKKKRVFRHIDRIKIIEYGCIGLVILLFLGLALVYGGRRSDGNAAEVGTSPSPDPTPDRTIRGMHVLDALTAAGFDVVYQPEGYALSSSDGVAFTMKMHSDDKGILQLSFETMLCADPEDETETAKLLIAENKRTVAALRVLFDAVMPVFHRTVADSDTIVKQSEKTVRSGEPYSKHFGTYTVRITSDPELVPQTVLIQLIRDP